MKIETIIKYLGKKKTINFIANRNIKTLSYNYKIPYLIYMLDIYGITEEIIKEYLLLRNHVDFNKYLT